MFRKFLSLIWKDSKNNSNHSITQSNPSLDKASILRPVELHERLGNIEFPHEKIPAELIDHYLSLTLLQNAAVIDFKHVVELGELKKCRVETSPVTREDYFCLTFDKTLSMQSERFVEIQELQYKHQNELKNIQNTHNLSKIDVHLNKLIALKKNHKKELFLLIEKHTQQIELSYVEIRKLITQIIDQEKYLPCLKEDALKYFFKRLDSLTEEKRKLFLCERSRSSIYEITRKIMLSLQHHDEFGTDEEGIKQQQELFAELDEASSRSERIISSRNYNKSHPTVNLLSHYYSRIPFSHLVLFKNKEITTLLQKQPVIDVESPILMHLN